MRDIMSPLDGIRSPFGQHRQGSSPPVTPEIEILTRDASTILTRSGDTIIARTA